MGKKDKVFVPWQVCPLCNGKGALADVRLDNSTGIYYGEKLCDVCGGRKVIPMFKYGQDEN
jgi:DnaJ-class molecular chaperone